ncbi:MAG TPA: F0F1 ATP synthase subunit B [Gemmatimonadaceae bacterium]|nr:F0F1 ATP synthase subunit B [Gemmatimonadaceae bacterium]
MNTILPFLLLLQEHAAGSAEEASGSLLSLQAGLMFWTLVMFVALWMILQKYAFKPMTAAVEAREKALEDAIAAAQADRDEAARILAEQKSGIEEARANAQKIIADSRMVGEKLRAEMVEETRAQQQEMLDRARREIESEKVRAVNELRREAVDLAIAGAGKVIEKNLDDDSNRRIVESFLASIPVTPDKR